MGKQNPMAAKGGRANLASRRVDDDPPATPKRATRPKRSRWMDDDDENVATPIFKSSTINNIIAAMEPSPNTGLADSAGSSPANPPTPTPEEEEDIGGREVGPWSLGEVLGKGTSGTVCLGAHRATGELVAIKVIAKSRTHITQTASLANLELREAERPSTVHRIPLGVEREVSILKLIRHPNVIQLIDVWANKDNLYIITEYVEKGDMFQFINWNGPVREHEAMSFFRQLMDGMQFIHSLNLCHRDLKLENVLVGPEGQVKIADFSMAAVHQFPQHRLQTPCGSPHFAAPEVLKKEPYDGRLADIWSMGIVLFCILGSRLPFDEKSLLLMAEKATKAEYDVPTWFSPEAVDFFSIVLVVDPTQRLSIEEMWGHPLIKNHNDVDDLSEPRESTGGRHENYPPIYESTVDPQLLRQLQAIYHDYAEEEILWKLRQTTANDFKLFYWLLYRHRERQLEKYGTGASNSEEERHLLKPPNWTNRYATCDFRRRVQSGQGSGNRFTLFGNGDGETEDDPFYPMGNPQLSPRKPFRMKPANADFAIHRYKVPRKRTASIKADNASILSSRDGSIRSRGRPIPNPRSRRAINLSHIRNRSATRSTRSGSDTTSLRSSATSGSDAEEESHKEESRKEESREGFSYIQLKPITHDISTIFEEDVVKSGEEVSGFCDRAFFENNSILEAEEARAKQESKPFRLSLNPEPDTNKLFDQSWYYGPPSDPAPYMNRPLPPVPKQMSAKSAEWLSKQKPPLPWAPYGGAYLFPNPPNLKFTIAGASPGSRHTIHDPLASDQSIPGPSVSAPLDDSSPHTAPEAPSAVPEASSAAPEAPLAVPKRRKSAYALFPTIHLHNKPPPPNLPPSAIPQVPNPPTRRSSWFRSSTKMVPDETVKIPRPSLNIPESVLPNPPTAAPAAPIPSIRVVVDSPPPRTPPPAPRAQNNPFDMEHPFRRHHPSGLELRPSNIPAPLNIRKISQPAAATGSTEAPTRVPIDIHRKVTLPNPPPVRERAPLAPRRQVSMVETQLRLKDEARAKELEAAKLKRAGAAVGVPAWMKRTSRGDALADDLAEISRVGRARLAAAAAAAAAAAGGSGSTPHETFAVSHGKRPVRSAVGSAGDKRAPTFNFSWPKWLPQPDAGKAGGKMAMRSDIIDDSDDYVTDVEEEESTLLPDSQVDVNATLRATARAARIKKMEQFRRETGLAAFSERVEASLPQRPKRAAAPAPVAPAPVAPAPASAAAPTPAPLDRGVEAKQPWIARLFGVKGKSTVKYLCFAVSRGRTLRKVIAQLHAWKSHGIEELVADPKRGMVWVTVSAKNSLKLKPVAFAIEVFRIVEEVDNVAKEIAIARITLEHGSARSMKQAVETMSKVFAGRGILVADKVRAKMMTTTMKKSGI